MRPPVAHFAAHLAVLPLLIAPSARGFEPDETSQRVARYLQDHAMLDLLELHLGNEIDRASDADRTAAIERLGDFYLEQLRTLSPLLPERALLAARAWRFTEQHDLDSMTDLQIELLIDRYLPNERTVELHQILLDDPEERARATRDLAEIELRLQRIEDRLEPETNRLDQLSRKIQSAADTERTNEAFELAQRNLSLTRYYRGWCGYSRAVLEDRRVPDDTLKSFGYLLGAKGRLPEFEHLERAVLEYEHVARAAIGAAMSKARNGDSLPAINWLRFIAENESISDPLRELAQLRLAQLYAIQGDWINAETQTKLIREQRDDLLTVPEARFLIIAAMGSDRSFGDQNGAQRLVQLALDDLVKLGEIGHILDLQRRLGPLPLIADRFLSQYARAMLALEQAESDPARPGYALPAQLFAQALKANDAEDFPKERTDCALKLAYCAVRAERPSDAIEVCRSLIEQAPDEETVEQARWLRIVATEQLAPSPETDEQLGKLVNAYILAYPSSPNAARLLLRHGVNDTIDTGIAIGALDALPETDPAAIPARRLLVQLYHQRYRAAQRRDAEAAQAALDTAAWLWDHSPETPSDTKDATARLAVVRMVLDIAMPMSPLPEETVTRAILRGLLLTESAPALRVHKDEILLRRVEFLIRTGHLDRAEQQLTLLVDPESSFARAALRRVFVASEQAWNAEPARVELADRVIAHGLTLIESSLPAPPEPLPADLNAAVLAVAKAAYARADATNDPASRELGDRMSSLAMGRGTPDEPILRRVASAAERSADTDLALDAWLRLLARYLPGEPGWYEARYESLRLMFQADPQRARVALDQYRVLHPEPAPEPWQTRLDALDAEHPAGVDG